MIKLSEKETIAWVCVEKMNFASYDTQRKIAKKKVN